MAKERTEKEQKEAVDRIANYILEHVFPEMKGEDKGDIGTALFSLGFAIIAARRGRAGVLDVLTSSLVAFKGAETDMAVRGRSRPGEK